MLLPGRFDMLEKIMREYGERAVLTSGHSIVVFATIEEAKAALEAGYAAERLEDGRWAEDDHAAFDDAVLSGKGAHEFVCLIGALD